MNLLVLTLLFIASEAHKLLSVEEKNARIEERRRFVEKVNEKAKYWKAELNLDFALLDTEEKARMQGSKIEEADGWRDNQKFGGRGAHLLAPKKLDGQELELKFFGYVDPSNFSHLAGDPAKNSSAPVCRDFRFDIRDEWPQCARIIGNVRDQSVCSSCYAVATAAAFSDRRCIALAKKGMPIPEGDAAFYSAADVMACSKAGGEGDACDGGYSSKVWQWFAEHGVVTGHGYQAGGCKPYPIAPQSEAFSKGIRNESDYPVNCPQSCSNPAYPGSYESDKAFALNYNVVGTLQVPPEIENNSADASAFSWEQTMKEELLHNGTITVDYRLFDDFFDYPRNGGIYQYSHGDETNPHVVRMIGYGKVNCTDGVSVKYWLVANSWGEKWGSNGLFRIARGVDECGIESRQIGFGTPKV